MNEAEAQAGLGVPRETMQRLDRFVALLRVENDRQNLVSRASLDHVWERHILDSAQLLRFAAADTESWLDLGSGAGFPGLIVSALHPARVTLVETRKLRAEFLARAAATLAVAEKTEILCAKAEALPARPYHTISARAFAPLDKLLAVGARFADRETLWILPKGRNAQTELEAAQRSWQGAFRLEQSLTDADAKIIVATGVAPKGKGKKGR
jgi:16S rRNA (guanine527-N7)-methyltransferase